MVLMVGASFADTETKTGSITVSNAAKGETYTIYKLFGATVDGTDYSKVAYTGTIPSTMTDYFQYTSTGSGYVEAKPAAYSAVTYYTSAAKTETSATATAYWTPATGASMSDGLKSALATWANGQTSNAGQVVADGGPVVFSGLALGYYVVTTSQGQQAISVDTTNLTPSIIDKNSTTYDADKTVGATSYNIGDTIEYTATFNTTNWIGDEQVKSYTIADTLPEFLSNVRITGLTIVQSTTDKTNYPDVDLSSSYTAFTNKQIVIPWVSGADDDSIYKNGSVITLTYTAVLTSTSRVGGAANTNTISITPNHDKTGDNPFKEHDEDDEIIKTYGACLLKVDGDGNPLAGAKFAFTGLTTEPTDVAGVYRVTGYDATATGLGTIMDTDDNGKLYILGLKANQTLTGKETEAPLGYNKLTDDITVTAQETSTELYHKEETRYYDAKGNLISTTSTSSHTVTGSELNLSLLEGQAATTVTNLQGTELPSTGGIGTTIFYVLGGLLVIGAAVILVARRKAEN